MLEKITTEPTYYKLYTCTFHKPPLPPTWTNMIIFVTPPPPLVATWFKDDPLYYFSNHARTFTLILFGKIYIHISIMYVPLGIHCIFDNKTDCQQIHYVPQPYEFDEIFDLGRQCNNPHTRTPIRHLSVSALFSSTVCVNRHY